MTEQILQKVRRFMAGRGKQYVAFNSAGVAWAASFWGFCVGGKAVDW